MSSKQRVYLIDASVYVFRGWFSYPDDIIGQNGYPVNAVHGYADFLASLLRVQQPRFIACAFDGSLATSFRNEIYPEYKANREPAPLELKRQFELCRQLTRSLGIPEFVSDRYEADDLLGTLASQARQAGHPVTIVSSDKDLTQLLQREQDYWWDFARNIELDMDGVENRFGVRPQQIADMLALAGDAIDNIRGIPGIGQKTAAALLQRYESLDGIYENLDDIVHSGLRGAARVKNLLISHEQDARLALRLTTVFDKVLLDDLPSSLVCQGVNDSLFDSVATQIGFSNFRRRQFISMLATDRVIGGE
jgi:5'-3' exonuclease